MEITNQDFSEDFWSRFGNKEKQYILDFCNTFCKTFPNIEKNLLLERIGRLNSLTFDLESKRASGLTKYNGTIQIKPDLSENDERNNVYHELLHWISYKGDKRRKRTLE